MRLIEENTREVGEAKPILQAYIDGWDAEHQKITQRETRALGLASVSEISAKVAKRFMAAPSDLKDALNTLKDLDELADNIEDSIETFSLHFRVGSLNPEVKTQFELLTKADKGLAAAELAKKQIEKVANAFPSDKTAQRSLKDADVMIKRFERLQQQARKVIGQLSKKQMPDALKKYASSVMRMLKGKLVDPSSIMVKPWQRALVRGDVIYEMVIFVDVGPEMKFTNNQLRITLAENVAERQPPGYMERLPHIEPLSPKQVVAQTLEKLSGWKGLKGETSIDRSADAQAVASALRSAMRSMRPWDTEGPEISRNNIEISAEYRSNNLPKEGANEVGYAAYDDMVNEEISTFRKALERNLGSLKNSIKTVEIQDGEKSWIYVTVILK
jgi:hypothetical protein